MRAGADKARATAIRNWSDFQGPRRLRVTKNNEKKICISHQISWELESNWLSWPCFSGSYGPNRTLIGHGARQMQRGPSAASTHILQSTRTSIAWSPRRRHCFPEDNCCRWPPLAATGVVKLGDDVMPLAAGAIVETTVGTAWAETTAAEESPGGKHSTYLFASTILICFCPFFCWNIRKWKLITFNVKSALARFRNWC